MKLEIECEIPAETFVDTCQIMFEEWSLVWDQN